MITIEPPSTISIPAPPTNLKRTLTRVFSVLLFAALPVTVTPQTSASSWQLTWSDEFNAPSGSPLDPAKWNIVTGGKGFGNNELETYTNRPTNVHQQNGNLVITAQKEDLTGPDGIPRHYTSARLNTQNHFAQKYGRFEARIQLPTGKGIWPAFWLLGDNHETNHWPNCGEIDILETIGAPDTMYSTLHGPGYSGGKGISAKFPLPTGESVHTAFHLYAVEWSPNDIKFFFDDHLIAHRTPADLPPNTAWVYDHPFYLLLNLAVGGNWPGDPDDTTIFPQHMLVDYVRVYSRKPTAPQATTKPGAPYIDSDVWASSEGRPSSSFRSNSQFQSKLPK
jgi:beta-glucanase (GH16 family)